MKANGVAQLIESWHNVGRTDWELHITGRGQLTEAPCGKWQKGLRVSCFTGWSAGLSWFD